MRSSIHGTGQINRACRTQYLRLLQYQMNDKKHEEDATLIDSIGNAMLLQPCASQLFSERGNGNSISHLTSIYHPFYPRTDFWIRPQLGCPMSAPSSQSPTLGV